VAIVTVGGEETAAAVEAKTGSMSPMRRIGKPEDIALMALYLASPASSWVTGKIVEVDGGTEKSHWPLDLSDR
jgi:7-alpha-hydroxysteroid dehydrogenase